MERRREERGERRVGLRERKKRVAQTSWENWYCFLILNHVFSSSTSLSPPPLPAIFSFTGDVEEHFILS